VAGFSVIQIPRYPIPENIAQNARGTYNSLLLNEQSVSHPGGNMNIRRTVLTVAVLLIGTMCLAQNVNMGTWKLNEAKSKIPAGFPKNTTVMYEAAGDSIKATVDGVDAKGKPTHTVWIGKFDGKDYPVMGDPTSDTRALKQVDARTLELTSKKGGKVTLTGKVVVAVDGQSRTLTASATDSMGMKIEGMAFYDKQ
jgi:hypothetical protein